MSYRIRRIDPFWLAHPVVIGVAAVGVVLALLGYTKNSYPLQIVGGLALMAGVLIATKPAVSAVLGTLGVLGGLLTFVLMPNAEVVGSPLVWRLVSTLFFGLLYMVLMDALVLVVSALYNFFGGTLNLGGIYLDIEEGESGGEQGVEA